MHILKPSAHCVVYAKEVCEYEKFESRNRSRNGQMIQAERVRLNSLSEKKLMVEMILELKEISNKCDEIGRKIVIWSN